MKLSDFLSEDTKKPTMSKLRGDVITVDCAKRWVESFTKTVVVEGTADSRSNMKLNVTAPPFAASTIRKQLSEVNIPFKWVNGNNYSIACNVGDMAKLSNIKNFMKESEEVSDGDETNTTSTELDGSTVSLMLDGDAIYVTKIDSTHVRTFNSEENYNDSKGSAWHVRQLSHTPYFTDMLKWLKDGKSKHIQDNTYNTTQKTTNESVSRNSIVNTLREGITAAFVSVDETKNGIVAKVSLDPIKSNSFITSRYMMFSITESGRLQQFSTSYKLNDMPTLTEVTVKSATTAVRKINYLIKVITERLNGQFSKGDTVVLTNATKYNPLSKSTVDAIVEGFDKFGNVIVVTKTDDYAVDRFDITHKEPTIKV